MKHVFATKLSALLATVGMLACGSDGLAGEQSCPADTTAPQPLNTNAAIDSGEDLAPQLATDGAGHWVALWWSVDDLGDTIGTDSDILFARSSDDGATWTAPAPLNSNAAVDTGEDRDAAITTDGLGNWVAVWWSTDSLGGTIGQDTDILVARSNDNGATWTTPAPLNTNAGTDSGDDGTFQSLTGPQIATDTLGNWVAVWQSREEFDGTLGDDWDILIARSTNNGATWTAPAPLNGNAGSDKGPFSGDTRPQISTDGTGHWMTVWNTQNDFGGTLGFDSDLMFSLSVDNGVIWSDPTPLNNNASTDSGFDVFPQLTVGSAGDWMAIWQSDDDVEGQGDWDVYFSRSTNFGADWSDPQPLNSNAATDEYADEHPQLTTDGQGNWFAVWQSRENTIGVDHDILFTLSTNNGNTWTTPVALNSDADSDSFSDKDPQLATDGAGNWVAVWVSWNDQDGTIGNDRDILTARYQFIPTDSDEDGVVDHCDNCELPNPEQSDCQPNGVGDVCELAEGTSLDCNNNDTPDECDIFGGGTSQDCNGNGVPDECDIADGSSQDQNADEIPDECAVAFAVDMRPGTCPNPFNRHGNGVFPVALVGTAALDPTEVDLASLFLTRADGIGGSVAPNEGPPGPHSTIKDAASPFDGQPCDCQQLGPDGIDDLSMKFRSDEMVEVLELNALLGGAVVELVLSGNLFDGTPFAASDCILILPPGDTTPTNAHVESNVADTFVEVAPLDLNFDTDGFADFSRSYYGGTAMTLTAPVQSAGRRFVRWLVDGAPQPIGMRTIEVIVSEGMTLKAAYARPARATPEHPTESDGPLE